ncbi:MAG: ABC transporter substrate-binding protein [Thermodesulfobacteriota bacterium]
MVRICSLAWIILMVVGGPLWAAEPVLIGALLCTTGQEAAELGQKGLDGIRTAHKMQPTVLGRPVELKFADTKSDKAEAANAVARLLDKDKVAVVIGDMISSTSIAASAVAEGKGIPMVSPTATNPNVTAGRKFVFRVCFIDPLQGHVGAGIAKETLKANTAALIYDIAQDYCVGLAKFFEDSFTKGGGKIVAKAYYKSGDRDFRAQLSSIKAANPDLIYAPIYSTSCALVAKQAKELGIKAPILAGDALHTQEFVELGGKDVEGILFTDHFHKNMIHNELGKKFLAQYTKDVGKELEDSYTAMGADAYFLVLDAITRAGSTDPKKIRDAIVATKNFDGISGKLSMNPDGNPSKSMVINKVQDGKFVYVKTVEP